MEKTDEYSEKCGHLHTTLSARNRVYSSGVFTLNVSSKPLL